MGGMIFCSAYLSCCSCISLAFPKILDPEFSIHAQGQLCAHILRSTRCVPKPSNQHKLTRRSTALQDEMHDVVRRLQDPEARHRLPGTVLWQQTTPQHFNTPTGQYANRPEAKKQEPFTCVPIPGVTVQSNGTLDASGAPDPGVAAAGGWRNSVASKILAEEGPRVTVIQSYNETVPLWQYHRNNNWKGWECSHYW